MKNSYKAFVLLCLCLAASMGHAQAFPPAFSKSSTYLAGDIAQYGGNWYRAMTPITANGAYPAAAYGKWELNFVCSNTTLTVGAGQMFANLVYAWQFARNARIADAAYLHLNIVTTSAPFSETLSTSFSLNQDSGDLISIAGDDATKITLHSTSDGPAFVLTKHHCIGSLSNLTITGPQNIGTGLEVEDGSNLTASGLTLPEFAVGAITIGVSMATLYQLTTADCVHPVEADSAACLTAPSLNCTYSQPQMGTGILADHQSTIDVSYSTITNVANGAPTGTAVSADHGASIDLEYSTLHNFSVSLAATNGARIFAQNSDLINSITDASASFAATVSLVGAMNTGGEQLGTNDGSYIYGSFNQGG